MKLEIGKKYNTKGGFVVEIIRKTEIDTFEAKCKWGLFYYKEDGTSVADVYNDMWTIVSEANANPINPKHYGGSENVYEAIKVIEAWDLGFNLGNTLKYISRAGKKDEIVQDLEKAMWYLQREIDNLKKCDQK